LEVLQDVIRVRGIDADALTSVEIQLVDLP